MNAVDTVYRRGEDLTFGQASAGWGRASAEMGPDGRPDAYSILCPSSLADGGVDALSRCLSMLLSPAAATGSLSGPGRPRETAGDAVEDDLEGTYSLALTLLVGQGMARVGALLRDS
jgi:hypothetical protein